jgi:hypothetical protein
MKVAVYSIALNEEQFVQRWFESGQGADYFLIASDYCKIIFTYPYLVF